MWRDVFFFSLMFDEHSTRRLWCFKTEVWNRSFSAELWDNNESMSTALNVLTCEDIRALSEDVAILWQTCCRFAPSVLLNLSTPLKTESSHLPFPLVSPASYPPTYRREENIVHLWLGTYWEAPISLYNNVSCLNCHCCDSSGVEVCEAGSRKSTSLCLWFIQAFFPEDSVFDQEKNAE